MEVVHFSKCHKNHPHEVEEVDVLGWGRLNTSAIGEVFDDLSNLVVVDVVVCDGVSKFGVHNFAIDVVPAVVEILEFFRYCLAGKFLERTQRAAADSSKRIAVLSVDDVVNACHEHELSAQDLDDVLVEVLIGLKILSRNASGDLCPLVRLDKIKVKGRSHRQLCLINFGVQLQAIFLERDQKASVNDVFNKFV